MRDDGISIIAYLPKLRHEILAVLSAATTLICLMRNTNIFDGGDTKAILFILIVFIISLIEYSILNIVVFQLIFKTTSMLTIVNGKAYIHKWYKEVKIISAQQYYISETLRLLYNFDGETLIRIQMSDGSLCYIEDINNSLLTEIQSRLKLN